MMILCDFLTIPQPIRWMIDEQTITLRALEANKTIKTTTIVNQVNFCSALSVSKQSYSDLMPKP